MKLITKLKNKEFDKAKNLHYELFDLFKTVFIETNPIPVKEALYMMGLIGDEIRLPLVKMADTNREKLKDVLKKLNIKIVNG